MSREYAENRIREALRLTGGHPLKARQQIIAWTYEDAKLLHALTKPHITGIVAYAINRVLVKEGEEDKAPDPTPDFDALPGEKFGKELLKALAMGQPAVFGQESFSAHVPKSGASQRHIDALRQIAAKSKTTKKD